MILSG
jgi:hypothetical protein